MKTTIKNNSEFLLNLSNPYLELELTVAAGKSETLDLTEAQYSYLLPNTEVLNYTVTLKDPPVTTKVDNKEYTEDELKNFTVAQLTEIAKGKQIKLEGKQDTANLIKLILEAK